MYTAHTSSSSSIPNCEGRWGTTDDFATSFLHFPCSPLPSQPADPERPVIPSSLAEAQQGVTGQQTPSRHSSSEDRSVQNESLFFITPPTHRKRGRKHTSQPDEWKQNVLERLKMTGQEYTTVAEKKHREGSKSTGRLPEVQAEMYRED